MATLPGGHGAPSIAGMWEEGVSRPGHASLRPRLSTGLGDGTNLTVQLWALGKVFVQVLVLWANSCSEWDKGHTELRSAGLLGPKQWVWNGPLAGTMLDFEVSVVLVQGWGFRAARRGRRV